MKYLCGMNIQINLILITIILLAALLCYVQLNVGQELEKKNPAERLIRDVPLYISVSGVMHEIQVERALAVIDTERNTQPGHSPLQSELKSTVL